MILILLNTNSAFALVTRAALVGNLTSANIAGGYSSTSLKPGGSLSFSFFNQSSNSSSRKIFDVSPGLEVGGLYLPTEYSNSTQSKSFSMLSLPVSAVFSLFGGALDLGLGVAPHLTLGKVTTHDSAAQTTTTSSYESEGFKHLGWSWLVSVRSSYALGSSKKTKFFIEVKVLNSLVNESAVANVSANFFSTLGLLGIAF